MSLIVSACRSAAVALISLGLLAVSAGPADAQLSLPGSGTWNPAEQQQVVALRLMSPGIGGQFNGGLPLAAPDMQGILSALADRPALVRVSGWSDLTVKGFDAAMVQALGLSATAAHVQQVAASAGLRPPAYFGTEVVARLLNLRTDHPAASDALELLPTDAITRAEAAHSLSVIVGMGSWAVPGARTLLGGFSLPTYTPEQLAPLIVAISKIGMPYVWGGVSDGATASQRHGGYDCSGLIWRTFKLSGDPSGARIGGRTAAQMAGEIPAASRVALSGVQPADLLFFGSAGFTSTATEASITHSAIALSDQWAIHSSGQGVTVLPLQSGWLHDSFAWARRVVSGGPAGPPPPALAPTHPAPPSRPRRHPRPRRRPRAAAHRHHTRPAARRMSPGVSGGSPADGAVTATGGAHATGPLAPSPAPPAGPTGGSSYRP